MPTMTPYSLRPRPAPDCWPMPYHRNMRQVMLDEERLANLAVGRDRHASIEEIVRALTIRQMRAVGMKMPRVARAGDLFPGDGRQAAQGWLRETPLFERYHHGGYCAYRLTPLGIKARDLIHSNLRKTQFAGLTVASK